MQTSKREALEQGKKTKKYGYSECQFKIISGILRVTPKVSPAFLNAFETMILVLLLLEVKSIV